MILLPVLPDETLFSRICRSVTVYGMSPSTMLQILFGKSDVSVHPILSSGLNDISLHTSVDWPPESPDNQYHLNK